MDTCVYVYNGVVRSHYVTDHLSAVMHVHYVIGTDYAYSLHLCVCIYILTVYIYLQFINYDKVIFINNNNISSNSFRIINALLG